MTALTRATDRSAAEQGLAVSAGTVLLALAVALGATLRLAALGWFPLDVGEAAIALRAAARFGGLLPVSAPAPLLVESQRFAFWFLHANDAVARLVPALAGIGMILLATALAPYLGRVGALVAAVLFAVSPTWTYFSRNLSDATVAGADILLVLVAAAQPPARRRWASVVALAALATAGPSSLTFALAAILGLVVLRPPARAWLDATWPQASDRRTAGLLFAATVVLAATGLLTDPAGFQLLAEMPSVWLGRLVSGGGAGGYVLSLLTYAPFELAFGVVGLAVAWRRRRDVGGFLIVWTLVALAVGLLWGSPAALGEILLPLTLAAALGVASLVEALLVDFRWAEEGVMAGILLTVISFGIMQGWRLADAVGTGSPEDVGLQLGVGALAMAGLLILVYVILWGPAISARAVGLAGMAVLGVLGWHNGARLNYYAASLELREPLRSDYVTPMATDLVRHLDQYAAANDMNLAVVAAPGSAPAMAWSLRNEDVTWAEASGPVSAQAVVRPADADAKFGDKPFLGAPYDALGHWRLGSPGTASFTARTGVFLRWYLQRLPPGPGPDGDITFDQTALYLEAQP